MDSARPHKTSVLINNYLGRPFNSPNDVVAHPDGSLWFTDPSYGHEGGFRPKPQLPNLVYRFDLQSGSIRAVADGLKKPKGLCFSPDYSVLYISDTDSLRGDRTFPSITRPSTIYAFDVISSPGPFLTNKRLFAFVDSGAPQGLKCDVFGNVYAGCGDGVHCWSPAGELVGKILVEGGVSQFSFGRDGEMWLFSGHGLWRAKMGDRTKGAVLGI